MTEEEDISTLRVEYNDHVIVYQERDNTWNVTINGYERALPTLREAKERVNRPRPEDKAPFERFAAYCSEYHDEPKLVEVTSAATPGGYPRENAFWIVRPSNRRNKDKATERAKVGVSSLFKKNEHNDLVVTELARAHRDREMAEKRIADIYLQLEPLQPKGKKQSDDEDV